MKNNKENQSVKVDFFYKIWYIYKYKRKRGENLKETLRKIMEAKQRNIGFNFRMLGEILFGKSIKTINEQSRQEKGLKEELDRIYAEEKKLGATKRIQELSDKLEKHDEKEKKQKIQKVETKSPKLNTEKQDKKKSKENDREIVD